MRINGFTQIKAFYSWTFGNQDKRVKPQHISLYLFLLNQNNRANWVEWFKCPYDLAMAGSCISSKKTYYKCLNDLQDWKLIVYKKGVNSWHAPVIKLEVLKDTSTIPQVEQVVEPLPLQVGTQLSTQLPTHIYKLITNNLKLVTDNVEEWIKNSSPNKENDLEDFNNKIVDIDDLAINYLSNTRVVNAVLENKNNKFKDLRNLEIRLLEFIKQLKEGGTLSKTMADFSSHFRYWHLKMKVKTTEVDKRTNTIPIG